MTKMSFNDLVKKRMAFLIIACLLLFPVFGISYPDGYNQTVGWMYDFNIWNIYISGYSSILFIVIYGILALFILKTHKTISKIHLLLFILPRFLDQFTSFSSLTILLLNFASIVIFMINIAWAIINRKK